jgi:hypothetical protein
MGYIKRVHTCPKPIDANIGDIWECDDCKTRWAKTMFGWFTIGERKTMKEN